MIRLTFRLNIQSTRCKLMHMQCTTEVWREHPDVALKRRNFRGGVEMRMAPEGPTSRQALVTPYGSTALSSSADSVTIRCTGF